MQIVIGSGKNRRSATIPHRRAVSHKANERIREDVKAVILRPTTFANHSGVLVPLATNGGA